MIVKNTKIKDDSKTPSYVLEFEKLKTKYRVCCEFEQISDIEFSTTKDTPVIFGYGHKVCIYPINDGICRAHILGSIDFSKKLLAVGVEIIKCYEDLENGKTKEYYQWGQNGEFTLDFYLKDIDKAAKVFKFKPNSKSIVTPYTLKNLHEYLRFMRNIDESYGKILDTRIASNKE